MSTTPPKGQADYLKLGDWNAVCAECGSKRKASEMKQLPDGVPGARMWVCPEHWNPRQPQDFVRGVPDKMAAPWTQAPIDAMQAFCTPNSLSAVPGAAQPGCMTPGYLSPSFNPESDI